MGLSLPLHRKCTQNGTFSSWNVLEDQSCYSPLLSSSVSLLGCIHSPVGNTVPKAVGYFYCEIPGCVSVHMI